MDSQCFFESLALKFFNSPSNEGVLLSVVRRGCRRQSWYSLEFACGSKCVWWEVNPGGVTTFTRMFGPAIRLAEPTVRPPWLLLR